MRRSTPRYDIIFLPPTDGLPVVVHAALNADEATVLFAEEVQRLLADRTGGELAIRRTTSHNGTPEVIVRQQVAALYP